MILPVNDKVRIVKKKWLRNKHLKRYWKNTKIWTRPESRFRLMSNEFSARNAFAVSAAIVDPISELLGSESVGPSLSTDGNTCGPGAPTTLVE